MVQQDEPGGTCDPAGLNANTVRPILSGPTPVSKPIERLAIKRVRTTAHERFLVVAWPGLEAERLD
jgi:hypothetical protein